MTRAHLDIQIDLAFLDLLNAARKSVKNKAVISETDFALYDAMRRVEALSEAIGWLDKEFARTYAEAREAVGQQVMVGEVTPPPVALPGGVSRPALKVVGQ